MRLVDLVDKLKEDIPGLWMRDNYRYGDGYLGMVTLGVSVQTSADFAVIPIYADRPDVLKDYLRALVEQLQLAAIREMGLGPKLRAQEKEVLNFRNANTLLNKQLDDARARIRELELELRALKDSLSYDDDNEI